jgi:hypothetical protein
LVSGNLHQDECEPQRHVLLIGTSLGRREPDKTDIIVTLDALVDTRSSLSRHTD